MIYLPKQSPDFLSEENFDEEFNNLEKLLTPFVNDGYLDCDDGAKLHYNFYLSKNATKNVVIVHGLSEFIRKYTEFTYFLLNQNCNVFIFCHRYHGYSTREIENYDLIHVNSFEEYESDLSLFIEKIVKTQNSLPICLFSHSMGGAIAGLYLQNHPTEIDKAIFSSAMICPTMQNVPRAIMRLCAKSEAKKRGWEGMFSHSHPFNPEVTFEDSNDLSYKRFKMNLDTRLADRHYQGSAFSNKWIFEATKLQNKLIKKSNLQITAKVLILCGENDKVVRLKPQIKFAKTFKDCTFKLIKGAKHNLYNSTKEIMQEFYSSIKEFLIR